MSRYELTNSSNIFPITWVDCSKKYEIPDEMAQLANDAELIDKVFGNTIILDKVLDYISEDPMTKLHLRVVSKKFDSVILHRIRKQHRQICISSPFEDDQENESDAIVINNHVVRSKKVFFYFVFLKVTANVKVQRLTIFESKFQCDLTDLHSCIVDFLIGEPDMKFVREFIGIDQLCSRGCNECRKIALNSKKYGPIQLNFLRSIKDNHHFEYLEVADNFVAELINKCVQFDELEALEILDHAIQSSISCDKLLLRLGKNSSSRYSEIGGSDGELSYCFPKEVLDTMVMKWKVKRVILEFGNKISDISWNSDIFGIFTKTDFNAPSETHNVTKNYFLESVEIEIEHCFYEKEDFLKSSFLDNLIAIVRKILPTKNMSMKLRNVTVLINADEIDEFISKLIKISEFEPQRNFKLTFQLYPRLTPRMTRMPEIFNSGARLLDENVYEEEHYYLNDVIDICEQCFVGKSFDLKKQQNNSSINFEIFFTKQSLRKFFKNSIKGDNCGYLRHFWNLVAEG